MQAYIQTQIKKVTPKEAETLLKWNHLQNEA